MLKLCIVAGARPNFMKISPIIESIENYNRKSHRRIDYYLVHTGQHYDQKMSELFFENLGIPSPAVNLGVGSASHAVQTAEIMKRFEKVCLNAPPTHVLVVGDVNSTIACALVASKLGIKIIHVEAGLRSFDRTMPEEINRVLTDCISDLLFTSEESANENLRKEGIPDEKVFFVGNVMIDALFKHNLKARQSDILYKLGLSVSRPNSLKNPGSPTSPITPFAVLTLHRPSNVDDKAIFQGIIEALTAIAEKIPIVFPAHPRTIERIRMFHFEKYFEGFSNMRSRDTNTIGSIRCIDPLGYLDFLQLMSNAKLILTDSGGIQEETTILGIPCVTLRENTERPITVTKGTNVICGVKKEEIISRAFEQLDRYSEAEEHKKAKVPPLWDGKAAERIVKILAHL